MLATRTILVGEMIAIAASSWICTNARHVQQNERHSNLERDTPLQPCKMNNIQMLVLL